MVSIGEKKGSAIADKNGRWLITLPAFHAGGPLCSDRKNKKRNQNL